MTETDPTFSGTKGMLELKKAIFLGLFLVATQF